MFDDRVEIVKKALCFPLKMDVDGVLKQDLDDNCVSNGPLVHVSETYILEILCSTIQSKV